MRSSQVQAGTARPLRSAGGRLLREMLKGEMPDLDFAEKCCIFALAQKEEVALAASSFALSSLRTGKRQFSAKLESRQFVSKSFVVSTKCFVVFSKSYLFFPACPKRQNGRPRHATKMGIKALVKKLYIKSFGAASASGTGRRERRRGGLPHQRRGAATTCRQRQRPSLRRAAGPAR